MIYANAQTGELVDPEMVHEALGGRRKGAMTSAERARLRQRQPKRTGYAAPPGSGPQGSRCWDCVNRRLVESPARRRFWKCALVKWTNGAGTDIRLRSPACSRFEEGDPPEQRP